jgi:hypothetical protein
VNRPFRSGWAKAVLVIGWAIIGYGVWTLFADASRTKPAEWVKWFLGALVAHDLIAAPIVFAVAATLVWRLPASLRAPAQVTLVVGGIVLLYSWPLLRAYSATPANPSVLPQNYALNVAVIIGTICLVAAGTAVRRFVRKRKESATKPPARGALGSPPRGR